MVQISNGNIVVTTEKRSLWESFRRFFQRNGKRIAGVFLLGAGTLMTTFGAPVPFLPAVGTFLIALGGNLASLDDGNDDTTRRYKIT